MQATTDTKATSGDTTSTWTTGKPVDGPLLSTSGVAAVTGMPSISLIQGKTLEEIINKWTRTLDEHVKEFTMQAQAIEVWDQQLLAQGEKISAFHDDVLALENSQKEVEDNLDYLLAQQEELEKALVNLTSHLQAVSTTGTSFESASMQPLDASVFGRSNATSGVASLGASQMTTSTRVGHAGSAHNARTAMYENLERAGADLDVLKKDLNALMEYYNKLQGTTALGSEENTSAKVAEILHSNLETLAWIEDKTQKLAASLSSAK